jgi:hypothetical protein
MHHTLPNISDAAPDDQSRQAADTATQKRTRASCSAPQPEGYRTVTTIIVTQAMAVSTLLRTLLLDARL